MHQIIFIFRPNLLSINQPINLYPLCLALSLFCPLNEDKATHSGELKESFIVCYVMSK